MPHGTMVSKDNGFVKEEKVKKHIVRVSQEEFEKGDPDFIDERIVPYKSREKKTFLSYLFE